ncbi:sugar ABC transporter permease [Rugosimonospora acidiphila]|uniref:Sugar ABC transporter permease n=1 Tax=Rugosimonospora acidiphila TaxID=556531 RepID=A0ABP9S2Q6_9ACTN
MSAPSAVGTAPGSSPERPHSPPGSAPGPVHRKRRRFRRADGVLLLMGLPALLLLFVFSYVPMAGLVLAFENYRPRQGIFGSAWVGLQNFKFLFVGGDAWRITVNTVGMNALFIVANLVVALGLALLLNEVRDRSPRLAKLYQSAMFLPYVFSYVVVTYFVVAFLDADSGLANHLLLDVGMKPIDWYARSGFWPVILTVVEVWKTVGFWVIAYLAAIIAINPEYYEAASMDGAGKWQQTRRITLPLLSPLITINLLLSVGHVFHADFGLFFQVPRNSSLLYPTTDVIDTYVYRALTSLGDVGMSAAAGLYQAVVGFVLVLVANWLVRRRDPAKALF